MSKREKTDGLLKYPEKEIAWAYRAENSIPFKYAVIGTTFPIDNYYFCGEKPSTFMRIEYILEGEEEALIGGEWKKAQSGDICVFGAGTVHGGRTTGQNPCLKKWITCRALYLEPLLDSYGISAGVYHFPMMARYFDDLVKFADKNPPSTHAYFEIAEYLHKIIYELSLQLQGKHMDDAETVRRMLDSMVYKKSNLDDIADALHMSKSNVIRIYKKRFGTTPHQYLMEKKIENGKLLLQTTSMSVREISEKLCIGDEHYFSTFFYKHVGVRPRDWRKG